MFGTYFAFIYNSQSSCVWMNCKITAGSIQMFNNTLNFEFSNNYWTTTTIFYKHTVNKPYDGFDFQKNKHITYKAFEEFAQ